MNLDARAAYVVEMRQLLLLLALGAPLLTRAQFGEWIRTGRPGAAIGAYTCGKNTFQVQSGASYKSLETGDATTENVFQGNVLRVGLTERFELSAVVGFARRSITRTNGLSTAKTASTGVNNTQVGFRYNVLAATDRLPAVSVQTRVLLRAQSEAFRRDRVGTTTIVSAGKGLTPKLGLTLNYGFTYAGGAPGLRSFYVVNPSYKATERLQLVADVYGDLNDFDLNVDFGVGYFLSRDLKVDAAVSAEGFGDFAGDGPAVESDWSVAAGVSWRVDWRGEG